MTQLPGQPHEHSTPYEQAGHQDPLAWTGTVRSRSNLGKAIAITVAILLAGGWLLYSTSKRPASTPASTLRTVAYDVTGSADSFSITAKSATGTEQASNRALPAHVTYMMDPGAFAYISAQNEGESGSITCTITVDGQVISRNTADGAFTIATCQGNVP
jgi:hypothetical protein